MLKSRYDTLPKCLELLLTLALVLGSFSCKPQGSDLAGLDSNLYDQSWLTGKPCAAPCWYGLEPGVSSREDSIAKVEQLPFIDSAGETIRNAEGAGFLYKRAKGAGGLALSFKNDVLDAINFYPNYDITFEQAVEKLGSPNGFWLRPGAPEGGGCKLLLIWKNQRIVLWRTDSSNGPFSWVSDLCVEIHRLDGKLPKNMLVEQVELALPSLIESLMKQDAYNPWKGFAN